MSDALTLQPEAPCFWRSSWAIQENASTLTVSGQWPTQCPPSLKNVTLDGTDLRIEAGSDLTLCDRKAAPFSIEVNPALAVDKTALDPGIYHVSFYAADGAGSSSKLRAASRPVSSKQAMMWAETPKVSPFEKASLLAISASSPGTENTSS